MLRSIKSTQRAPRQLAIKMDGTNSVILVGKKDATLTVNGTGDYTFTFAVPFARIPVVSATVGGAAIGVALVTSATATAIRVKSFALDASYLDTVLHILVQGYDSADSY